MAIGDLQVIVGKNMRRIRLSRGQSQEAMADQMDLHRTYVGGVERGERNLSLAVLEKLCERIDVSPYDLLVDADTVAVELDASGRPHFRTKE